MRDRSVDRETAVGMIGEMHEMFARQVCDANLPDPVRGYMLSLLDGIPGSEVLFDFAWSDRRIAVRIDHDEQRIYERAVRYVAEKKGWCVCYFTDEMVRSGVAILAITTVFANPIAPGN